MVVLSGVLCVCACVCVHVDSSSSSLLSCTSRHQDWQNVLMSARLISLVVGVYVVVVVVVVMFKLLHLAEICTLTRNQLQYIFTAKPTT